MSVGIPGSNPAYSLQSVLQAQLQGLSQPNPPSSSGSPTAAADPATKATYNNLPIITPPSADQPSNDLPSNAGGASTLPAPPPAQPPGLDAANAAAGTAADLATSTTASTLTAGGSVSLQPYKGSAAQLVFTNDATGEKSVIGTASAGLTTNVNGSNVTVGNFTNNDVGVYAAHQEAPTPLPGTQDIAVTVGTGASQGSSTDPNGAAAPTQISSAILQGANTDAGHLSGLISQYA